jgi:biopolymer transport protein TolR
MGGSASSSRGRRGGLIEGINVTPLVDITLVLLIIFIVTAKMVVAPAVPLDLPKSAHSETVQTVLSVLVPVSGPLIVDGAPIAETALEAKAKQALANDPELRAVIQADRNAIHGRVMGVLDRLKTAGLVKVAFGAVRPEVAPSTAASLTPSP